MPLGYGGGLRRIEDVQTILGLGVEKVVHQHRMRSRARAFVAAAVEQAGGQSVVVSIDVRKKLAGTATKWCTAWGRKGTGLDPVKYARQMEALGMASCC